MLGLPKRTLIIAGAVLGVAIIYTTGAEQRRSEAESGGGGAESAACAMTVTADVLNVRSGPGTDTEIVDTVTQDTEVDATTTVRDGFRKIDAERWASDEYLEPVRGADCG